MRLLLVKVYVSISLGMEVQNSVLFVILMIMSWEFLFVWDVTNLNTSANVRLLLLKMMTTIQSHLLIVHDVGGYWMMMGIVLFVTLLV